MSILNKNWKIQEPAPREFLDKNKGLSPLLAQIIWNRGLREENDINSFLQPDYNKYMHDPFLLKDMDRAVGRLYKAIQNKEKIYIYGDYDADGVCASTILKEGLESLGAEDVSVYIPHREEEGYGMNMNAIDEILEKGAELIITVDCGSTNVAEAEYAENNGVDVIVTDHHQVLEKERFSCALVNPHQKGDKYPLKDICGTAVAFKVVQALSAHTQNKEGESPLQNGKEKWMLDLVAIATVADVMPLVGENRTIVKYGLLVLAQTRRPGLRALMDVAGIKPEFNNKEKTSNLDAFHIGFVIGPRINAAGRMDHASLAFDLMNAPGMPDARKLAWDLEEKNNDRRKLVSEIISEIDANSFKDTPSIFEGRPHWPIGVLGIVAGRLAEDHNKPSFIYQKQEGKIVGSVRTPEYANTVEILKSASHALVKFGGHAQAGGFTADPSSEKVLKKSIHVAVGDKIKEFTDTELKPSIDIDKAVSENDISWENYYNIARCAPFGEGNAKPVFLLKNAIIENINMVGSQEDHLKCDILTNSGTRFKAIGFRLGDKAENINNGDNVDVVFEIDKNEWNGKRELNLKLEDIKKYE